MCWINSFMALERSIEVSHRNEFDIDKVDGITTFLNHYSFILAMEKAEKISKFDRIYIDGTFLVLLFRALGIPVKRRSFDMSSIAPIVLNHAETYGLTIVLIGSESGVSEQAKIIFEERYPKIRIIGSYSGFFADQAHRAGVLDEIVTSEPSIVICGMGTPFQDEFLLDLKDKGWRGLGFTCGGFLHQTAKKSLDYYPRLVDKFNLRWLYRIYDEPRTISRYTKYTVKFLYLFMMRKFFYKE